jgi:hypothetical protein
VIAGAQAEIEALCLTRCAGCGVVADGVAVAFETQIPCAGRDVGGVVELFADAGVLAAGWLVDGEAVAALLIHRPEDDGSGMSMGGAWIRPWTLILPAGTGVG